MVIASFAGNQIAPLPQTINFKLMVLQTIIYYKLNFMYYENNKEKDRVKTND